MEQSDPSAQSLPPSDIVWQQSPAAAPAQAAVTPSANDGVVPHDIIWSHNNAEAAKPSSYHTLKAIARGFNSAWGAFTGDPESEIKTREKMLGIEQQGTPTTSDKVAEFVGGVLMPAPGGIAKEGMSFATARAADKSGFTAGQLSDSRLLKMIERSLARLPGGGSLIRAIERQSDTQASQLESIVDGLSQGRDPSLVGAGKAIKEQLKIAAKRMKEERAGSFDEVERLIPGETPIGIKSTMAALEKMTAPVEGLEKTSAMLANKDMVAMKDALQKDLYSSTLNALPYSTLKSLRTKLGQNIEWGPFSTDTKNGQMKQLYEALTADMNNGAASVSDGAAQAVKRANAAYAASKEQQKVLVSVLNKAGGSEKVFTSLMSGTREGDEVLRSVLSAVDQPTRNLLAASALQRMGRATASAQDVTTTVFSADTFLTNWGKMSAGARDALFGQLPGDYSKNVTQLSANVSALKGYTKILANPSHTAMALLWGGEVTGAMTALLTGHYELAAKFAGAAGSAKVVSMALTNPHMTSWLARRTTQLVQQAAKGGSGLGPDDSGDIDPLSLFYSTEVPFSE